MPGVFCTHILFAQAAPAEGGGALPSWAIFAIQMAPILLLGYLLFGLPMRQQRKRLHMIGGLKKNDRVVTEAGIYGTVVSIDNDTDRMVIRIDDDKGVKLTCRKSSVMIVESSATETKDKPASTT